ncbi:short-chain dehydrogenase/reductase family protein, putative [Talaromyces islandicus]|uniref:Short-chain dehydrogenase/reductase family protein, putative n=1 Tax=Talaromyces islandicus TaxID=28573 RepID=A0A0U1M533_TALIS|nr:short-chain dehydrogenase/reductase family protein, putative [Talaromyces islandicus]
MGPEDVHPSCSPLFPHIFFKNQFRSKPTCPSIGTSFAGKVAIVTGTNQGLKLETADQLLSIGLSRLIISVRSIAKGEAAANTLRAKYPQATINVFQLDMSSYSSIQVSIVYIEKLDSADLVILNVGVRKTKFELCPNTGHEETIQVNYISTALLYILLPPLSIIGCGLAFLSRKLSPVAPALMALRKNVAARSMRIGASTYVDAAVLKGKKSHGSYIMSWKISPFVRLLYTADGKQITENLWQETMAELSFADVQGILDSLLRRLLVLANILKSRA